MPLRYLEDSGYQGGFRRDEASFLLGKGEVYDSLNLIYDNPGVARLRQGTTNLVTGAQTAYATSFGCCYSQDATPIEQFYGIDGRAARLYAINKTTGATTTLSLTGVTTFLAGRACRHFGFLHFPMPSLSGGTGVRSMVSVAGQTSVNFLSNGAVAQIANGNRQITLTGADVTTGNVEVGATVKISDATHIYYGRVISVDTAKIFSVWPTPTWTNAAVPIGACTTNLISAGVGGGSCVTSFQNRLLLGNTNDGLAVTSGTAITDRRIYYSILPTEEYTPSTVSYTGAAFLAADHYPPYNYIEAPGSDAIVAIEPIDDSRLLILTTGDVVIFEGNLVTQLATTSPAVTYDIFPLGTTSGCLSDLSVSRSPIGIIWAGVDGVFALKSGNKVDNLMTDKIATYWTQLQRGSNFAVHGGCYVRGHYLLTGQANAAAWGLLVNLTTGAWTRISNLDIFDGVPLPSNPAQIFGLRWWDQTAAQPSMTNGQMIRLESMFDPYTPGSTEVDADGTPISFSVTTRVLAGDPATQKIMQRGTIRYQAASPTANIAFSAQSKIDASDIIANAVKFIGTLSSTEARTITAATTASPIVCTTSGVHGYQNDDYVDINGGLVMTNINGRYRITVLSTTTFSLQGSTGNGVYTASSASVKKLTESDYQMTSLDEGQGVSFTIANTSTVNNFELHGIRVAMLESAPVMSA